MIKSALPGHAALGIIPSRALLTLITILLAAAEASSQIGWPRPSPPWSGTAIPEPPAQHRSWSPPATNLSRRFVSAAAALFQQGLADPRECEYRIIQVGTGSCWSGDAGLFEAHAWVLPARTKGERPFAVCWNGLVYPVVSVGARADLAADVRSLTQPQENWPRRWNDLSREQVGLSHESVNSSPIKLCLLLRLGRADLLQQIERLQLERVLAATDEDPYLGLARQWVWALFDRTVCAHMRGDDHLALAGARALVPIQKSVNQEAKKRGIKLQEFLASRGVTSYVDFLGPLPTLLADQERRARAPKRQHGLQVGLDNFATKEKRIAALIEDLEDAAVGQMGQPGGVNLGADSAVSALIHEGDAAVEPLLQCLETDERLTRSVHFHRDFSEYRSLMGVHEAAYVALANILQTSFFAVGFTGDDLSGHGREGRKRVADAIRDYWRKYGKLALTERWYRILADDWAGLQQWLEAAGNIVRPVDVANPRSSTIDAGWVSVPERKPGQKIELAGAGLRNKKNPSVSDLLRQRLRPFGGAPGNLGEPDLGAALELARALARWDGKGSLADLAWLSAVIRSGFRSDGPHDRSEYIKYQSQLCLIRARLGDTQALDEYSSWVTGIDLERTGFNTLFLYQPLWRYPEHPQLARAAEWIFGDPRSPWVTRLQIWGERVARLDDFADLRLLDIPAFRRVVMEHLKDRKPAGTVRVDGDGKAELLSDNGNATLFYERLDPLAPKAGTSLAFRVCDLWAHHLFTVAGCPKCELYWPEAKRDEAVSACAAFLANYGKRLQTVTESDNNDYPHDDKAKLVFPRLDHPATRKEEQQGLAIFSLEGEGATRRRQLPSYPLGARWVTLKAHPRSYPISDAAGKEARAIEYVRDCEIWQCEEVLKDKTWHRYFGVVGPHEVARVPATEIEFPTWGWGELSGHIDFQVALTDPSQAWPRKVVLGRPVMVTGRMRNRDGLEVKVPSLVYRVDDPGGPAFYSGVTPHLGFLSDSPENRAALSWGGLQPVPWTELKARPSRRFQPSGPPRELAFTQEMSAFQADLRDWFEMSQPGFYRFWLSFSVPDGCFADGKSNDESFQLQPAPAIPPKAAKGNQE